MIEQGLVGTFIVKDMSRFGRDYLQVGQYTELYFPSKNIRFIAVNDGVDSAKGEDDFTPFRNLFNDFYAKDTSRKIRAAYKHKSNSGKHISNAPYGYIDDPDEKGVWLLDEEAAPVVKGIFDLVLDGKGIENNSFSNRYYLMHATPSIGEFATLRKWQIQQNPSAFLYV